MQQRITVIKVAWTRGAQKRVEQWLKDRGDFELDQHKEPWLLYYAQWFDPWLAGCEYDHFLRNWGVKLRKHGEGLWEVQSRTMAAEILKSLLKRKIQHPEQRWLRFHLWEAISAYSNLCVAQRVFMKRRVTNACLGDDELVKLIRNT